MLRLLPQVQSTMKLLTWSAAKDCKNGVVDEGTSAQRKKSQTPDSAFNEWTLFLILKDNITKLWFCSFFSSDISRKDLYGYPTPRCSGRRYKVNCQALLHNIKWQAKPSLPAVYSLPDDRFYPPSQLTQDSTRISMISDNRCPSRNTRILTCVCIISWWYALVYSEDPNLYRAGSRAK